MIEYMVRSEHTLMDTYSTQVAGGKNHTKNKNRKYLLINAANKSAISAQYTGATSHQHVLVPVAKNSDRATMAEQQFGIRIAVNDTDATGLGQTWGTRCTEIE